MKVQAFCDNTAAVGAINARVSKDKHMMHVLLFNLQHVIFQVFKIQWQMTYHKDFFTNCVAMLVLIHQ